MPAQTPELAATNNLAELEKKIKSGANWFYWIAGLSLINSLIILFGGEWNFIFGLGITQVIDAVGQAMAEENGGAMSFKIVALALSAGGVATYALFGWLASRHQSAGFVIGMVFYGCDTFIFLAAGDFVGVGFHVFALFLMGRGSQALREWQRLARQAVETVTAEPAPAPEVMAEAVEEVAEKVPAGD